MDGLSREFYCQDGHTVAKGLLGQILVHETPEGKTAGKIVEVEAYMGAVDKAAHSYKGRSSRTEIQYGPGGFAYIYFIYGMYYCMNVVANQPEKPEAILIRALEPVEGLELMEQRRKTGKVKNLCNGPGKLCQALGIDKSCYGEDLLGSRLYILPGEEVPEERIEATPRINIDYAEEARDFLWRYLIKDNLFVSKAPKKKG